MKKKIGIYLNIEEHDKLKDNVVQSGKTLSNYCKDKIFDSKSSSLELYILREIENLLYIILSQIKVDEKNITNEQINAIASINTYIGNLKAKNNKELKIKKDYSKLFLMINKNSIEDLILKVNSSKSSKEKIFLMANFITSIKNIL